MGALEEGARFRGAGMRHKLKAWVKHIHAELLVLRKDAKYLWKNSPWDDDRRGGAAA